MVLRSIEEHGGASWEGIPEAGGSQSEAKAARIQVHAEED